MTPDELASVRESLKPDWHELRERRVLEQALDARRRAREVPARPRRWIAVAAAAVAVAAGVVLAIEAWPAGPEQAAQAPAPRQTGVEPAPVATTRVLGSDMRFADGSTAVLSPGASVEIEEQTAQLVRVAQPRGSVHYRIVSDPARLFLIEAAGAEIAVLGTEFDVEVIDGRVRVSVVHGRVRVRDGSREVELAPRETLQIAPSPIPRAVETTGPPESPEPVEPAPRVSAAELERRADRARIAGRHDEAIELLERLVALEPHAPRAGTALFTIGSIDGGQGRHWAAARRFAQYRRSFPRGMLYEDALAGEAVQSAAAGDRSHAAILAADYAERYPSGPHVAQMRRLMAPPRP